MEEATQAFGDNEGLVYYSEPYISPIDNLAAWEAAQKAQFPLFVLTPLQVFKPISYTDVQVTFSPEAGPSFYIRQGASPESSEEATSPYREIENISDSDECIEVPNSENSTLSSLGSESACWACCENATKGYRVVPVVLMKRGREYNLCVCGKFLEYSF